MTFFADKSEAPNPADWRDEREALRTAYLDWVTRQLPTQAVRDHWPIHADHCFMRMVLDHVFEDCWYLHLDRRYRAYRQLDHDQLRRAVSFCEEMSAGGRAVVARMNQQSLAWRDKVPKAMRYRGRFRRRRK